MYIHNTFGSSISNDTFRDWINLKTFQNFSKHFMATTKTQEKCKIAIKYEQETIDNTQNENAEEKFDFGN